MRIIYYKNMTIIYYKKVKLFAACK
jgi:hypothetical protein